MLHPKYKYVGVFSTQYPFDGGASTLAYYYHHYLLQHNIKSRCLFFYKHGQKPPKKSRNPNKYPHIYYLPIDYFRFKKMGRYFNKMYHLLRKIKLVIAVNYGIIPIIHKYLPPKLPGQQKRPAFTGKIIYQITGCPELTLGSRSPIEKKRSYIQFMKSNNKIVKYDPGNRQSLRMSHLVIANSPQTYRLYRRIYPKYAKKIVKPNYLEYELYKSSNIKSRVNYTQPSYTGRHYDLIAIANDWDRTVKNPRLVYRIFSQFPSFRKIIIGKPVKKHPFHQIPNTTIVKMVSNSKIKNYLRQSKIVVIGSYFESASITLLEGLSCHCKIITSRNVALHVLLPPKYICRDTTPLDDWVTNIKQINRQSELEYRLPSRPGQDRLLQDLRQALRKK